MKINIPSCLNMVTFAFYAFSYNWYVMVLQYYLFNAVMKIGVGFEDRGNYQFVLFQLNREVMLSIQKIFARNQVILLI